MSTQQQNQSQPYHVLAAQYNLNCATVSWAIREQPDANALRARWDYAQYFPNVSAARVWLRTTFPALERRRVAKRCKKQRGYYQVIAQMNSDPTWYRGSHRSPNCIGKWAHVAVALRVAREKYRDLLAKSIPLDKAGAKPALKYDDFRRVITLAEHVLVLQYHESVEWGAKRNKYPNKRESWCMASLHTKDISASQFLAAHQPPYASGICDATRVGKPLGYLQRGHYLPALLVLLGVVKRVWQRGKERMQLSTEYRVSLRRIVGGTQVYERTLAGQRVDWCAVVGRVTYHAASVAEAIRGARHKVFVQSAPADEVIDYRRCLALGFCKTGIREFADKTGLQVSERYTRGEIAAVVTPDLQQAYSYELQQLGVCG